MLYIPKTDDDLNILADDELKDFAAINFSEYFKSTREKLFPKPSEEILAKLLNGFISF